MAQVIANLENYQGKLAESLGLSLGQGIGNGLNTFFANRSLDSVLKDKGLERAPTSKKLEALRSALAPYGEKGQEILKQRFEIEKLEHEENENKKQEATQKKKNKVLGKYLNGGDLTPDEQEMFTPQEFIAMHKAKFPKPTGGTTSQPIPPEIIQKISYVLSQSQDLSADDLKNSFDSAGIPSIYTNQYIENRRRQQETASEHDIKFHQESADFENSVNAHANTAKKQLPLIENGIKSVSEGKINPGSLANVFNYFGEAGKKIGNALLSKDEAALLASVPEFLEGRKEIFGVRLSDADLRILQDKLPDIAKRKEANLAILDLMKRAAEKSIKLQKVAHEVLEKKGRPYRSGKLRPLNYEKDVINAFDEQDEESYVTQAKEKTFQTLPSASDYKGKVATDKSNGKRYKSDGTKWVEIK